MQMLIEVLTGLNEAEIHEETPATARMSVGEQCMLGY